MFHKQKEEHLESILPKGRRISRTLAMVSRWDSRAQQLIDRLVF
jgi:hypothetical protein